MTMARRLLVAALAALPVGLVVAGSVLSGLPAPAHAAPVLVAAPAALVGALLLVRFPRNAVGWALFVQACTVGVEVAAIGWHDAGLPGGVWLLWVAAWIWAVGLTGVLVLVPLTFPDGRLPSRHWRAVLWVAGAGLVGFVGGNALFPAPLVSGEANPMAWSAAAPVLEPLRVLGAVAIAGSVLAAATAAVRRFRRAQSLERAQLKWFASGAVIAVLGLLGMSILYESGLPEAAQLVMGAASTTLPLTIAVAIFRYRLYDIDRLVSRTVSYTLLTTLLAGVYLGSVLALPRLLPPLQAGSELTVAAATLAAAALFAPARRRIQHAVDRRFNRARYDAEQVVAAFRERLRAEVELEDVVATARAAVVATVEPARASLWLVRRGVPT